MFNDDFFVVVLVQDDVVTVAAVAVAAAECLVSASRIMKILGDGRCVSTESGHLQLTKRDEKKKEKENKRG